MKKKIWTARILASILIWDAIGMGWNGNGIPVRGGGGRRRYGRPPRLTVWRQAV